MKALDTNAVVRFLVRDDKAQALRVKILFERAEDSGERFLITTAAPGDDLGYHVNFIRFEVFTDAPGYLQRKEFGANDINIVGSSASGNYVRPTAGGTAVTLSGTFALTLWPGDLTELRLTVSVTDDRNSTKELVVRRIGDSITALRALARRD